MSAPANPANAALSALGLSAGYGRRQVLHGVTIEVRFGELFAIVGPNGAGKSTLMRLLCGSLKPWQGVINLLGQPLESFDRRTLARRIASVAQENSVAFSFTALEIVLMGRAPHLGPLSFEGTRDLEIAHDAMERLGVAALARRRIEELSGGERKRVFLARALAQQPAVVLLDEPSAFLDLKHVAEVFHLFRELCEERGVAVIATLHDLNAAAQWADRVLLLKGGATVACGAPREVLTRENLKSVYETEVYVGRNPATGAISVLPAGV